MQPQKTRPYSQHQLAPVPENSPEASPPAKVHKGKQREKSDYWGRDSMDVENERQRAAQQAQRPPSMGMVFTMEPEMPAQPRQAFESYSRNSNFQPEPAYPVQSQADPTFFRLPPAPKPPISAPLQPRLTDLRAHIERDPRYSMPTYSLEVTCKIKFEPGDLR